jgi:hypothetical protein
MGPKPLIRLRSSPLHACGIAVHQHDIPAAFAVRPFPRLIAFVHHLDSRGGDHSEGFTMSRIIIDRNDLTMGCNGIAAGGYRWFRINGGGEHVAVGIKRCAAYTGNRGKWEVFGTFGIRGRVFPITGTYSECVRHAYGMLRTRCYGTTPAPVRPARPARRHRVIAPAQLLLAFACVPVRVNTSSDVAPPNGCYSAASFRRPGSLG